MTPTFIPGKSTSFDDVDYSWISSANSEQTVEPNPPNAATLSNSAYSSQLPPLIAPPPKFDDEDALYLENLQRRHERLKKNKKSYFAQNDAFSSIPKADIEFNPRYDSSTEYQPLIESNEVASVQQEPRNDSTPLLRYQNVINEPQIAHNRSSTSNRNPEVVVEDHTSCCYCTIT